jgi:hypothetical protein
MIYALLLITATGAQTFGNYANLSECQAAAREFQRQEIKAGCVRQESQEESAARDAARAQNMMKSFMQMIPAQK